MVNPFELILAKLDRIENAIANLKITNSAPKMFAPMNVREVS